MFERAERGNRAVILHPMFAGTGPEIIDEFQELCRSAGVDITAVLTAPRDRPDARFFVGKTESINGDKQPGRQFGRYRFTQQNRRYP